MHNRRLVSADLQTIESAHKLVDEIAPKLKGRTSGHLRIEKTGVRRGDNVQLARVSFVDDLKVAPVAAPVAATPKTVAKPTVKKPAAKKPATATKETK